MPFLNDPNAPEHKSPETLGRALFDAASYDDWAGVFGVNTFSIYFLTTAFLGLLATGSADVPGYTSSVINITSISGFNKIAQCQVCFLPVSHASRDALTHALAGRVQHDQVRSEPPHQDVRDRARAEEDPRARVRRCTRCV